jgi:hypothetical protein
MATKTLGTNATNSLVALQFYSADAAADIASIAAKIKDDKALSNYSVWAGAFSQTGLLAIPNRGMLQVLPGDWVAVDTATGWPILLSGRAITSGPYTHS